MIIIDAKDLIVGRLGTKVAKQLLLKEEIAILNCEKAVFTGKKEVVFKKYDEARKRGAPLKGPFNSKRPDFFLRRVFRGMLPYKTGRGEEAFANLKCYVGIPKEFEGKTIITYDDINKNKKSVPVVSVLEVCKALGFEKM
ncbi:MAG: 50S ribosomal protein L13 [Candidatus Nanoarchaeia archaeon]|nr:50S ribosomal protein L13 [Candidatus Nanoarchaeia archaeon]